MWITVKEAADLAHRDTSRIYAWIREDRLASEEDSAGVLYVLSTDVLELEVRMTRRKNNKTRRV